uniref:Uncharacterized protein n=1 Tax=Arundo donax TaxID=35708 RepID=A0A0A9C8R4_ARUDO
MIPQQKRNIYWFPPPSSLHNQSLPQLGPERHHIHDLHHQ